MVVQNEDQTKKKRKDRPKYWTKNLQTLRNARGKTQEEMFALLEEAGLKASIESYKNWEQGYVCPKTPQLYFLADYFGVSIDYLLDRYRETTVSNKLIADELGLTNAAINQLRTIKAEGPAIMQILNLILSDPEFINYLGGYIDYRNFKGAGNGLLSDVMTAVVEHNIDKISDQLGVALLQIGKADLAQASRLSVVESEQRLFENVMTRRENE